MTIRKKIREYSDRVYFLFAIKQIMPTKCFASEPYSLENDMDFYKLSAQLSIINRDNIHSIGELEGKIQRLKEKYEKARQEINSLAMKQERLDGLIEQAETYFELIGKPDLSVPEQLRLKICRQTLESTNISNRFDFDRLKGVQQETDKNSSPQKTFEDCEVVHELYRDISKRYYVSKLVEEKLGKHNKKSNMKM